VYIRISLGEMCVYETFFEESGGTGSPLVSKNNNAILYNQNDLTFKEV